MKNLRIKITAEAQKAFVEEVYIKSGLSTKQLAQLVNIHPRSLIDWKNEKLTIPLKAAEIFCKEFYLNLPGNKQIMVQRWEKFLQEANSIGGFAAYRKYGCLATQVGRSKGGRKALALLRERGDVPLRKRYIVPAFYNTKLAEYIGIMLGDDGLTLHQCCITLNIEADAHYISFVINLARELFGESPKIYKHNKAVVLYYNGIF